MTPLRLIILAILFYLGYRMLRGLLLDHFKKKATEEKKETKVEDVLVECPVCHTLIPKKQAIRVVKNDETHYLCSEKCCDSFTDNPEESS